MVIVIGGMIGLGKTTISKLLSEELNIPVFYESVEGNKVLPLYYTASEAEQEKYRYPFLLQLNFLTTRFHAIKQAMLENCAIMDRSIYEDLYFATKIHQQGRISDLEFEIYNNILSEMMQEVQSLPKKTPDVMVYLKGPFDMCLKRIAQRGRSFEIDPSLKEYYHFIWEDYDSWMEKNYTASPVITLDTTQRDCLLNPEDRKWLIESIKKYVPVLK